MIKLKKLNWIIILLFLAIGFSSCTRKTSIISSNQFSENQNTLINNGSPNDPMRVFLLTNKEDSILLRKECQRVVLPTSDPQLKLFTQRLFTTVRDSASMGVGIAAPQVGILKNIIWVQRFDKEGFPFEVYYNPNILEYSIDKQDCQEGCLSIPNISGVTKTRAFSITMEHQKLNGEIVIEKIDSFTAVIFQHEIDHLNGILFIDHLQKEISSK